MYTSIILYSTIESGTNNKSEICIYNVHRKNRRGRWWGGKRKIMGGGGKRKIVWGVRFKSPCLVERASCRN